MKQRPPNNRKSKMWPLSNITTRANASFRRSKVQSKIDTNRILCQAVGCMATVDRFDQQSPIISKRNIRCVKDSSLQLENAKINANFKVGQRNNIQNKKLKSSATKGSVKGCIKESASSHSSDSSKQKKVSFDIIEVREHPRILGDNPSTKKGPPLSLGWYQPTEGRILRFSVDEYEKRRNPHRHGSVSILSPTQRQRMLLKEAGVTPKEIVEAQQEMSKIRKSRRDHNVFVDYDETAIVLEQCFRTVQRLLTTGSVSEWELRSLMEQSERSKQQSIHAQ
jgi:hypothetical protein